MVLYLNVVFYIKLQWDILKILQAVEFLTFHHLEWVLILFRPISLCELSFSVYGQKCCLEFHCQQIKIKQEEHFTVCHNCSKKTKESVIFVYWN
jgi:hypothetical protein